MNSSAMRIPVIILAGVLVIALALVLRHNHKSKNFTSLSGQAIVLAADGKGAVTQTEDGTLRGFDRSGKKIWQQAPQYAQTSTGKALAISKAFCAGDCPAAYTNNFVGGANRIEYHAASGAGSVTPGAPLNANGNIVADAIDANTIVVREPAGNQNQYVFTSVDSGGASPRPLTAPVKVDKGVALQALASSDGNRVLMLEIGTLKNNRMTTLRWFRRNGASWKQTGGPIKSKEANACLSGDGKLAAVAAKTVTTMDFGGGGKRLLPISANKSSCSFSSDGVSVISTAPADKFLLVATHFDPGGKQVWTRSFTHAAGFNAQAGVNNLLQVTNRSGTQFVRASDGKTQKTLKQATSAVAEGDDVFVQTNPAGKPVWLP